MLIGDLVINKDQSDLLENVNDEEILNDDDNKEEEKQEGDQTKSCRQKAEIDMIEITEQNIANYTIEDVIFPVVGSKVKLPSNPEMRAIIEEIMAKDNMSIAKFNS